jgi:hypothetical protein
MLNVLGADRYFRDMSASSFLPFSMLTPFLSKGSILRTSSKPLLMGLRLILAHLALSHILTYLQFKYFHDKKALWTVNYVCGLSSSVIEYNDRLVVLRKGFKLQTCLYFI